MVWWYWITMWDEDVSDSEARSRSSLYYWEHLPRLTCLNKDDSFGGLCMTFLMSVDSDLLSRSDKIMIYVEWMIYF